ncbi:hypothetical protein PhaeoP83_02844 [Phaeobacter inhibens]|uniref:Uncharacterized protein n=1 Tax=Phaeobacter inhibens TaxID=221822 RepID=A0ABN5GQ20_9RHOB|nr:hypothetical protein [Phaeobacter inhibens]AUQ51093.1 hypothetical protein PhaeoP83_02844 [Phaeobacter inhibens]AUQ95612.1 hypothetical protein PhaeoP66_02855 [Phaeobacter inhibens]AUR20898.1 hypothetical protein PhaeoP80_02844 [Phaeobacter inhibens]
MTSKKEATRRTIVTKTMVFHQTPDDEFFPNFIFSEGEKHRDTWCVSVYGREGMRPEELLSSVFFLSQAEAQRMVDAYPVGSEVDPLEKYSWLGKEAKRREFFENLLDEGVAPGVNNAGDEESPLAFNTLDAAGITNGFRTSRAVLDFLGKQRVGILKAKHSENWGVAAVFEYCILNLPHSSPAYIAAAYQFHWYITGDEFKAGYLWRDLECVVSGAEQEALKAIEMRKRAGEKGRQSSAKARSKRIASLLAGMETMAKKNPDIIKLGPTCLAALGLDEAIEADPKLWSQGRGQVEEYIGEMKRGEAGQDIQARYLALLLAKTA